MLKFKKRNFLVLSLVMVLCCISYLNYAINKYSLLETSSDFTQYEENQLAEVSMDDQEDSTTNEEEKKNDEDQEQPEDTSVVDSTENGIKDIVSETSASIETTITSNQSMKTANFFIESRLNMTIERERMVSMLNEMINNEMTDENNRKAANDVKMKLIDVMNKEKVIENLIKAKGFEDALVFITDNSVNVIVETEKLTETDMAKILDIVLRETKVSLDNIKILNKF